MTDLAVSIIRTIVPLIVGTVVTMLASRGINLDDGTKSALQDAMVGVFTALYYAVVRFLEVKFSSKFGWLLGYAKTPTY